jgi:hypothetical protein
MPAATCQKCRAEVAAADTLYSPDGDVLCPRCYEVVKTHREIEQACDSTDINLPGGFGDDSDPLMSRSEADALHRLVDGVAQRPSQPVAGTVACAKCQRDVPVAEAVYGSSGLQLCPGCAKAARERRRVQRIILGVFAFALVALQLVLWFLAP